MNLSKFPDDGLFAIFAKCPLNKLILLRRVCSRWQVLIEKFFRGKHTIKIFGSFRSLVEYMKNVKRYNLKLANSDHYPRKVGYNELIFSSSRFDEEGARLIAQLFPNVKVLVFFYYNWPKEEIFGILIAQWINLKSITFFGMPQTDNSQQRIWEFINSISSLKRLHLFGIRDAVIPDQFPALGRLEQFSLTDYREGNIVPVLTQLSSVCKQLLLDYVVCNVKILQDVMQANPSLVLSNFIIGRVFFPKAQPQIALLEQRRLQNELLLPRFNNIEEAGNIQRPKELIHFITSEFKSLQYLDATSLLHDTLSTVICLIFE